MVSEPLLKLLDDAEEKAVLGHEFAHLVHRHAQTALFRRYLTGVTNYACLGLALREAAQTGQQGAIAVGGAIVLSTLCVRILHPGGTGMFSRLRPDMTPEQMAARRSARNWARFLWLCSALASLIYLDPALQTVCEEAFGLYALASLCNLAGSRNEEYEADRGIVALKASPLALITGLRKLDFCKERDRCRKLGKPRPEKAAPLKNDKASDGFFEFFSSHPTTAKRAAQLCATASALNIPEQEIEAACTGDIPVAGEFEISDEFISKYTGAL